MTLTAKHLRFVDEFMIDRNATAAYIRAGYSETGARQNASRLITNDDIQEEIRNREIKLSEKSEMNAQWVLQQYKDIIDNTKQTDPNVAKGALDSVAKHLGMFKDKVEVEHTYAIEQLFNRL